MQQRGYNADIECDNGYLQWHDLPQRSLQELYLHDRVHTTRGKLGQAHVTLCHAMSRHRDVLWRMLRLTGRGSFPASRIFSSKQQSWRCPLNHIIFRVWSATRCRWGRATLCPLTWWRGWSTSTPWWCSPTGSWWLIRVGDIMWDADIRPRRNSCRMTSTWGKPSGKTWMVANLDNCKNVDP